MYYSKTGNDATWTTVNEVDTSVPGYYNIWYSAEDESGNLSTAKRTVIVEEIEKANLVASAAGSNLIDEANNTINNFNSFAIKFDRDLTFNPLSSNKKYKIEMEYSVDGITFAKSGTVIDNWQGTLVKNPKTNEKYQGGTFGYGEYTIPAGSPIYWNGIEVQKRYPEIYNAILNTKGTDNKVYVRTVFTVIQPDYTESYTLGTVTYSKGGYEVTPRGLPQI